MRTGMPISPLAIRFPLTQNAISALRFLGAVCLLFFGVESCAFWVIYCVCGISDMVDGYLARKIGCESKTGAMLDSLADLAFVICCCFKLIPALAFPKWLWVWGGVIVAANKVTEALLFVGVPLTLFLESIVPMVIIAVVATFAAVQEGHFIRMEKRH